MSKVRIKMFDPSGHLLAVFRIRLQRSSRFLVNYYNMFDCHVSFEVMKQFGSISAERASQHSFFSAFIILVLRKSSGVFVRSAALAVVSQCTWKMNYTKLDAENGVKCECRVIDHYYFLEHRFILLFHLFYFTYVYYFTYYIIYAILI